MKKIWGLVRCGHCGNTTPWQLTCVITWDRLYYLPVMPRKSRDCESCSVFGMGSERAKGICLLWAAQHAFIAAKAQG